MADVAQLMAVPREVPLPEFAEGDTIRVHVRVVEGSRERLQVFDDLLSHVFGRGEVHFERNF